MGVMTTLAMEYVVSPLGNFLIDFANGFRTFFEVAGRARAAAEMTRLGYHREAKALMMEIKEIRGEE
tara:strand:+ start:484 stop:684 length:201 start_codon:yes stop_codon:yes gene_type:complete